MSFSVVNWAGVSLVPATALWVTSQQPKASKLQRTKSNLTVLSEDQASRRARQAAEAELPKAESALGKVMKGNVKIGLINPP